ncbi:MAG TPA: NTP transferase domain-containing protein [Candidatus Dormibacteraeota bacterium]|nr:NTP transferase domain-containing protein [Candidatus Dormibacteraeota bacterium]
MTSYLPPPIPQPLVLLAAGRSVRMGRPKPLLRWRGATLLEHACQAVRSGGVDPVLVVAEDSRWLRDRAGSVGEVIWVSCRTATQGQSESLRAGLAAARAAAPAARAVLVGLVDQVGLHPEAVRRILESVAQDDADVWVADYGAQRRIPGHPVALGPMTWPLVDGLRGDVGARDILKDLGTRLKWVPLPAAWRPFDCDTPEDYQNLLARDGSAESAARVVAPCMDPRS